MKEIIKMDVLSVGKVYAVTMAILGLFAGIIIGLIGAVVGSSFRGGMIGPSFGIASIIIFPVLYGMIGFLAGIIGSAIYNLVAKWVGGIEIELKDK